MEPPRDESGFPTPTGYLVERVAPRRLVTLRDRDVSAANVLIATARAALPLIAFRSLAGLGPGVNQVLLFPIAFFAEARRPSCTSCP